MKVYLFFFTFFVYALGVAQSYSGKGDVKFQIGAQFQEEATGIGASFFKIQYRCANTCRTIE